MKRALVFTLVTTAIAYTLSADIMPIPGSQRLKPIFDSSDLVCYGVIKSVSLIPDSSGPTSGTVKRLTRFVVDITDFYKANAASNEAIVALDEQNVPISSASATPFQKGRAFLFFLKSTSPGNYVLTDPFLGATSFNSISIESSGSGMEKLQEALKDTAVTGNDADALRALQLLEGFDAFNEGTIRAVKSLSARGNPDIALTALAVMIGTKKKDSLEDLAAYLRGYHGTENSWAFVNIESDLAQFRDPQTFPTLKELSHSRYVSVRDGAVRALRGMKNVEAVPTLVERLDDDNAMIRYLAVISLAETLSKYDGDYAPSMYLFDRKPQYYVGLWKKWWAEEGSKLYPSESTTPK